MPNFNRPKNPDESRDFMLRSTFDRMISAVQPHEMLSEDKNEKHKDELIEVLAQVPDEKLREALDFLEEYKVDIQTCTLGFGHREGSILKDGKYVYAKPGYSLCVSRPGEELFDLSDRIYFKQEDEQEA